MVVQGAGGLGIYATAAASDMGAGQVITIDGLPNRLELARQCGATTIDINEYSTPESRVERVKELTEGRGVDVVLEGSGDSENPLYLEWKKALESEETRRVTAFRGQTIALDGATRLEVLNPAAGHVRGTGSDRNNNGLVLRLVYGDVSFLLTADIEAEAEERLLERGAALQSSVLKVPHHGSKTSTTRWFLLAVSPVSAVISAAADNPYGHPHPEVLGRLEAVPGRDRTFITAERGDIEFITDGERLWVSTER